ncbi:hypothetical protein SK128_008528, partial [Halocaridina rubra]
KTEKCAQVVSIVVPDYAHQVTTLTFEDCQVHIEPPLPALARLFRGCQILPSSDDTHPLGTGLPLQSYFAFRDP